jgi:glucosamine--fructose-6-phosphate aminotransferase (isomerizing)
VDYCIKVSATISLLSPVVNSVVLQLLAYHAAKAKSCPIDFPRNLAKNVTVE